MENNKILLDYLIISKIVEHNSKVLDLGCGSGDMMLYLEQNNNANVQGIEISEKEIYECVEKGLSVFHSDIDGGLDAYPDNSFDYVILNQSLQQVEKIDYVLEESLRVGKKIIVGFPNFAHISLRNIMFFKGKAPVTECLPDKWYDTPNIRFLSIKDFEDFCGLKKYKTVSKYFINKNKKIVLLPNLFAQKAIFVITK